ncbi:hypothetical protein [Vreelandella neptunia]|uniref:Uncharacterized protein n=1 Tax=Vreelandella neptunia TaxID=115551 RepID=A0ABS9S2L1_9GAMM|nr:hypothetical protein [Halomonas neptunia]MCH4810350.1 hypothetical protein [Halomonas neptunia]
MATISDDVQFSELMSQIRHLGATRFVMLGVFVALTVGGVTLHYKLVELSISTSTTLYTRIIGTAVASMFIYLEILSSYKYKKLVDRAITLEGSAGMVLCGESVRVIGPVTLGTIALYTLVIVIWWIF